MFEQFVLREPLVRELSTLRLRIACEDGNLTSDSVALVSAYHFLSFTKHWWGG